jgi:hypothetical protein
LGWRSMTAFSLMTRSICLLSVARMTQPNAPHGDDTVASSVSYRPNGPSVQCRLDRIHKLCCLPLRPQSLVAWTGQKKLTAVLLSIPTDVMLCRGRAPLMLLYLDPAYGREAIGSGYPPSWVTRGNSWSTSLICTLL